MLKLFKFKYLIWLGWLPGLALANYCPDFSKGVNVPSGWYTDITVSPSAQYNLSKVDWSRNAIECTYSAHEKSGPRSIVASHPNVPKPEGAGWVQIPGMNAYYCIPTKTSCEFK